MGSPHLAAILLLAALSPAQRTWIVDKAGGAGVDFADIPPAIAAAAPGDTVRVLGSSSVNYSGFTLSKGLLVEAPGGAGILSIGTSIVITQLPAGQVAIVSGFGQMVRIGPPGPVLSVTACAGNVVLSGMTPSLV